MTIFVRNFDVATSIEKPWENQHFWLPQPPETTSRWPKVRPRWLKIDPRWLQDLPKTTLNKFILRFLFRDRFWCVLGPTWAPFDPPLGAQDGSKIDSKNIRKSCCRKMASKILPRRSKIARRRPSWVQDGPRGLQDGPRGN